MSKIAFVFSGQGSQYIGMGREIIENFKASSDIFDEASDVLGFNLKEMVFDGEESILKITKNTQPAILATSIACLQPLIYEEIKADVVAGLSLGEYTAHVMAGTMSFRDAISLVRKRGQFMQEAVPVGVGTMAAILGLSDQEVIECCNEASGLVEPANFNCPGQVVVSGEIKAVEEAVEKAKERGAKRAVILPVSAPFHCSMLKPAAEQMAQVLDTVELHPIEIPVVSNVTGKYISDYRIVKQLLIEQITSPVLWAASISEMVDNRVKTFVEIGPGKTLSTFIRKIYKEAQILNIEDVESLKTTIIELQKIGR